MADLYKELGLTPSVAAAERPAEDDQKHHVTVIGQADDKEFYIAALAAEVSFTLLSLAPMVA